MIIAPTPAADESPAAEARARRRAKYLSGLYWHIGTFLIINGFFWVVDLAGTRSGLQWAYWITVPWALGLAFHVLAYLVDGRDVEERKTRQYLAAERARDGSGPPS